MAAQKDDTQNPERWEQHYRDAFMPWDTGCPDSHLTRVLRDHAIAPCTAVDIGCGTGTNVVWLSRQGFTAVGTDLAPTAIAIARGKAGAAACRFEVADLFVDTIPGGPFGFVYDRGCFHTFDDPAVRRTFVSRVAAHTTVGGIWHSLIGSTDGGPREDGPPRRSAAEITAAVEPDFEILELRKVFWDQADHAQAHAWVMVARRRP